MKAIFLDVDYVLNNEDTKVFTKDGWCVFVDDYLVARVKEIVDRTGAIIILSSDWRYGLVEEKRKPYLEELKVKLSEYDLHIAGYTPILKEKNEEGFYEEKFSRGIEIQKYLDEHLEIEEFVILDDRIDMYPNMMHLVRTKHYWGLTEQDVEKAINILNGKLRKDRHRR